MMPDDKTAITARLNARLRPGDGENTDRARRETAIVRAQQQRPERKSTQINVRVTPETKAAATAMAATAGLTLSAYVEALIMAADFDRESEL